MWIDIKFLPFLIVSHIMQLHLCNINMLLCIFWISQSPAHLQSPHRVYFILASTRNRVPGSFSSVDGRRKEVPHQGSARKGPRAEVTMEMMREGVMMMAMMLVVRTKEEETKLALEIALLLTTLGNVTAAPFSPPG